MFTVFTQAPILLQLELISLVSECMLKAMPIFANVTPASNLFVHFPPADLY
jgi:hypothetical protein